MRSNKTPLLVTLALAQLLIGIDYNIVFVALPQIGGLGFGAGGLQWVVSAYAIGFGGLLLLFGRLVDHVGRFPIFAIGLALFAIGSTIGGLAPNAATLVLGRAIQGVGGAALAPATLTILVSTFAEGSERNRALGVWGAAGSSGMVLGSILGGLLTDFVGWRSIFLINLPLVATIAALVISSRPLITAQRSPSSLDISGAFVATATTVPVVTAFTLSTEFGWASAQPWSLIGLTIALGALLVVIERRAESPMVDWIALRRRPLAVGTASTFLFMAGFGSIAYFITLYLQQGRGLSPILTGLAFVAPCAGVLLGTRIGANLATRSLRQALVLGNAGGAVVTAALATLITPNTSWIVVLGVLFALSIGQGVTFTAMFATATTNTPEREQGAASGVATTGQQLGGAVGLAMLVSLTAYFDNTTRVALLAIAAISGLGAIIGMAAPTVRQTA